ncbi:MAG: glutathione S-transferase family protein [Alphaproteobacteria bacterium]|nr:glutathione S-transferase family protein [Alphaproteobacteria bacterium]
MPTLIHFSLDPFSRRMRLALAEYGVGVDLVEETPWDPSHDLFDLNPAGTVPVYLEDTRSPVSGVEAIGEFLEEIKGGRVSLIPGDAYERAEVRRLAGWFDVKFYAEVSEPVVTEKVIRRFLPRENGGGGPDMNRIRQAAVRLRDHLAYVGHLADTRTWLAGEHLSIADLAAAAHISVADYFGDIPWAEFPSAKSWYQRIKSRPSFRMLLSDTVRGMAPAATYADLDF